MAGVKAGSLDDAGVGEAIGVFLVGSGVGRARDGCFVDGAGVTGARVRTDVCDGITGAEKGSDVGSSVAAENVVVGLNEGKTL